MSETKLFISTAPEPVPVTLKKITLEKRSGMVWKFLEKRGLISLTRLADRVGYDRSNFMRLKQGRKKIPQKLLLKVEKELSIYGLTN